MKIRQYHVIGIYVIMVIVLTYPLVFHLDGFGLPRPNPDTQSGINLTSTNNSYAMKHLDKIKLFDDIASTGKFPVITDRDDVSQTFLWFGYISIYILGLPAAVFQSLFFLLVWTLSGYFMYLLAKEFFEDDLIALFSGFVFLCSYYVPYAYYLGQSDTMQIQWIPFIFLMLEKTLRTKKIRYAVLLGSGFALQIISGTDYTVYLSLILLLYLFLRFLIVDKKFMKKKETYVNLALSIIIGIVLSSFYLIKKLGTGAVIRTVQENMVDQWRLDSFKEILSIKYHLYTGTLQLILAGLAIYLIYKERERFRKYLPFAVMVITVLFLMIGPFSVVAPYYWLWKFWPFFNRLSFPSRMYPFFLMNLAMLSGMALLNLKGKEKKKAIITLMIVVVMSIILYSPWLFNLSIWYP